VPERSPRFASGRHAGILIPLFSIPSCASWGIGEIADLPRLARWVEASGLDFVQLLPVNEMEEGQSSPYSALSAMAIDPIFIAMSAVEEFVEAGGERSLDPADLEGLQAARTARVVDYETVRVVKSRALRRAFSTFLARHWRGRTSRAQALREFREREAWWLDEYALFRGLHEEHESRFWLEWPEALRDRQPAAIAAARERLAEPILYFAYLQWLADEQWQRARRECGIGIFGDFPFMVGGHSADVWTRQDEFRLDASVGVPPDAFSESGQDWGLPVYRWDVIARTGYQWLRDRTRRCAELYDGFRVDHLVGFYRTFVRERDGCTYFVPGEERAQRAQGELLMNLFASGGARLLAEDLGTVPDFVRDSMASLGIPGMKVLRWEREWDAEGQPFRDPLRYPPMSVSTSGTHDTETLAEWWDAAGEDERRLVTEVPSLQEIGCPRETPFPDAARDALIRVLLCAGSDLTILPLQDVFGWRDRINTPASIGERNWTWRLPWPVEDLMTRPDSLERAGFLRRYAGACGRRGP
jgi:4-alpha-glucanotransferase